MPTFSIKISQEQESAVMEVVDRNPGWDKTLVGRALLDYFVKLDPNGQVDLVKKHRVIMPKIR